MGSSKSAFIFELNKYIIKSDIFVHRKYDYCISKPYSAFKHATNIFYDTVSFEDENIVVKYCSLTQDTVREDGKLLANIIVNLRSIIRE